MRYYCSSKPRFVSPDLSGFETNTSLINDANVVQTFLFEPIFDSPPWRGGHPHWSAAAERGGLFIRTGEFETKRD